MVPTLLIVGFVAGLLRKRAVTTGVALIAWPTLLVVTGVDSGPRFFAAAGILAVANTAIGALVGAAARRVATRREHALT